MKLYTMGPVQMNAEVLEIGAKQLPYFRTEEFAVVNRRVCENIKVLINADKEDETYLLTCSGSGAMEAAIINAFDDKDRLFILNGGTFGQRFCDICTVHNIPFDEYKVAFEEEVTYESLEAAFDGSCNVMVVNMHETAIGKLYNMNIISDFCKNKGLYLVVDAISSFLADDIKFEEWQMDMAILSSQKGMAVPPGMAAVVCSKRIIDKIQTKKTKSLYFDFRNYKKNMERGQTPFTPAVGIVLQMDKILTDIRTQGVEKHIEKIRKRGEYFRERARKNGILIPAYRLSNALTPILLDGQAKKIYHRLVNEEGIYVTPSGGAYEDRLLRIGHLGCLELEDYDILLNQIGAYMEK